MAKDHRKIAEEMKQTLTMTCDGINDAPALTQVFLSSIRTSAITHVCGRREVMNSLSIVSNLCG